MGLFGGFKAKFTRNSTAKSKPQEVVCLKYHIHGEFDSQDASPPPSIPIQNNIKKNEVIRRNSKTKTRKALAKSAIFPDGSTSSSQGISQKSVSMTNLNGAVPKPIKSAESSNSVTVTTKIETPLLFNSTAKPVAGNSAQSNGLVTDKTPTAASSSLYSSTNGIKTDKKGKSILKPSSTTQSEVNGHSEPSTLILMTQHHSDTFVKNVENGEHNYEHFSSASTRTFKPNGIRQDSDSDVDDHFDNFKINFVPNKPFDEQEDFKVNHVQHDLSRRYSQSEDERSYQEEEPIEFTKMGFSSQAASIFFGQDIEPEVTRPRRVLLRKNDKSDDDEDRRSSGADC